MGSQDKDAPEEIAYLKLCKAECGADRQLPRIGLWLGHMVYK